MLHLIRHARKVLPDAPLQGTWIASSVSHAFLLQAILRQRGLTKSFAFRSLPVRYISRQYHGPQECVAAAWREPFGNGVPN